MNTLTVNGQVKVDSTLVLQPSSLPNSPVAGQIFYNQATIQLGYYDGKGFVYLNGAVSSVTNNYLTTNNNTYVTNQGSVTNIIQGGGVNAVGGTSGDIAMFTSANTLGNSIINQVGNNLTASGSSIALSSTGNSSYISTGGALTLSSATATTWGVGSASAGQGGSLTLQAGTASDGASNGGNLILQSGSASGSGISGNASINTGSDSGTTGTISITSGNSSTTASGDVTVDTGSGFVSGTIIRNISFEDNTDDNVNAWFSDSVAPTNTQAHTGTYSLGITVSTGSGNWGIIENDNFSGFPVVAGHHIFFSAWFRAGTTPRTIGGNIIWYGSSSTTVSPVIDTTSGWTQASVSAVVPAGVTMAYFNFGALGAPGEVHYIDDISMTDLSSSASTSSLNLGATNAQIVTIGNMNELGATTIDGGSGIALNSGSGPLNVTAGAISVTGSAVSSIGTTFGSLSLTSGGNTGGGVYVKPQAASTTAFQVQDSDGTPLLTADSTNNIVTSGGNFIVNTPSGCNYNRYTNYVSSLTPTAYWKMEDLGTTAADSSGNNDTGTLSSVTTNATPGPFACANTHPAMTFSTAGNSKITTATSAVAPTVYSQVVMFKTTAVSTLLLGYTDNGGNHDRELLISNSGHLVGRIYNVSLADQMITSSSPVNDGNWHIAVLSESSAGMYLYVDGALVASNSSYTTPQSYTGSWTIGGESNAGSFNGQIAEVAITSTGLNALQAQSLGSYSGFFTGNLAPIGIGTTTPGANLDVEGNGLVKSSVNSATAFLIQNSTGGTVFSADTSGMVITVANLISTGTITVDGHIITGGNTPGIAADAGACTGGTASITGTNTAGIVTVTTGTGCSGGGNLATITFSNAFGVNPTVVLTPGNPISQTLGAYVDDSSISITKFDLGTNTTPANSQTFRWNYHVIQ